MITKIVKKQDKKKKNENNNNKSQYHKEIKYTISLAIRTVVNI